MTDAKTAEKPAAKTEGDSKPKFKDALQEATFNQLEGFITKRNSLVGNANAAKGDRVTLTEQLTEESQDPEIVKAREARDEAIMLLHKLVSPQVEATVQDSSGRLNEIEAELKELDGMLKPGLSYYKKLYGDEAAADLPTQARLQGLRISSAGTGGRRVRGYDVSVTVDGKITGFENMAGAAKFLEVDTKVLQEAFFETAKVDNSKDAADEVNFTITIEETDEDENKTERDVAVHCKRKSEDD